MQIGSLNQNPSLYAALEPSAQQIATTDAAFDNLFKEVSDKEKLAEIAGHGVEGMLKWRIREMQKDIAEKSLAARNLTIDQVKALPPKQRVALENQILQEVAEKLKEAIAEQMKKEALEQQQKLQTPAQHDVLNLDLLDPFTGTQRVNLLA